MYTVYMLRCSDATLYTGMTNHLEERLARHNQGKGAKYTRSRTPVYLAYAELCATRSDALKREAAIKKLSRQEKEKLASVWAKEQGAV